MKTIKEIDLLLQNIQDINDPIFEELSMDQRKGVQKLVKKYQKSLIKLQKLKKEHLFRQEYEIHYQNLGYQTILGMDEVGRGPLAGPLVIAAVVLPQDTSAFIGVNDSKQLSANKRQRYVNIIKKQALAYAVKEISIDDIDLFNIYQATKKGMESTLEEFPIPIDFCLVDAVKLDQNIPHLSIVKGDQKSLSIAAASILAKDYRDQLMIEMAKTYPQYGFDTNVGYGTKYHLQALHKFGPCPIHRKSFEPVKSMLDYS